MIKISTLNLFYKLAIGTFSQNVIFNKHISRFKFFTRGLLTLPYTLRWLEFLNDVSEYRDFLYINPSISKKTHRPYMTKSCSLEERLSILQFHYNFQKQVFSPEQQHALLSTQLLELACLTGKDAQEYRITLSQNLQFQQEGELLLRVLCETKALFAISFSFYQSKDGTPILMVGGLQGLVKGNDYALIKEATKSCYGLFPKKLLCEALMELANQLDINSVYLICDEAHIFKSWRYRKEIAADYDSVWQELGATKINKQFYELHHPIFHKSVEEIESKKRSEYKKRLFLLTELKSQISTFIVRNDKKTN
jgi:uncharacterized protein